MYSSFGFETNIENAFKLAAPLIGENEIVTVQDLRSPLLKYLQSVHQDFPILANDTLVVKNQKYLEKFASAFSESVLNDLHQERLARYLQKTKFAKAPTLSTAVWKNSENSAPILASYSISPFMQSFCVVQKKIRKVQKLMVEQQTNALV